MLVASRNLLGRAVRTGNLVQYQTRYFTSPTSTLYKDAQPDIKLYQYHICPFCNITKSLLSFTKLDYQTVEVNPLTKAELKPWSGEYKNVPIAIIDDKQINGSEEIINTILSMDVVQDILQKQYVNKNSSNDFQQSDNAKKWTRFAIDDLAALLYPNICGTLGNSYNAFDYVNKVESFSSIQKVSIQYLGALAMYMAASKVKSKRNITDEKASLSEALDRYESEGLQNGKHSFSSGKPHPDLGDVAIFGVLYSGKSAFVLFYHVNHVLTNVAIISLHLHKLLNAHLPVRGLNAHDYAIEQRGGAVKEWYDRMSKQIL